MTDQSQHLKIVESTSAKAVEIEYRLVGDLRVPINVPPRVFSDLNDLEKTIIDAAICQLRVSGMTFESVSKTINKTYNMRVDRSNIFKRYAAYLSAIPTETYEEARALSIMRASSIFQHAYKRFKDGGSVEFGKVAVAANDQMIKMLGLDAPTEPPPIDNKDEIEATRQRLLELARDLNPPEGDQGS